jgi:hypothetical protein
LQPVQQGMSHLRLYIVQLAGIFVLLCGYLLSDQPDSLSVMHFDPSSPSVITKADKSGVEQAAVPVCFSSQDNTKHKSNIARHISFEIMLPHQDGYTIRPYSKTSHIASLPICYSFLFYKEINPPPPKAC